MQKTEQTKLPSESRVATIFFAYLSLTKLSIFIFINQAKKAWDRIDRSIFNIEIPIFI